jgi:hypothetical protein
LQGLLVALQNASPKSLIVVFTDNGSKDLDLEREIVRYVNFYQRVYSWTEWGQKSLFF